MAWVYYTFQLLWLGFKRWKMLYLKSLEKLKKKLNKDKIYYDVEFKQIWFQELKMDHSNKNLSNEMKCNHELVVFELIFRAYLRVVEQSGKHLVSFHNNINWFKFCCSQSNYRNINTIMTWLLHQNAPVLTQFI